MSGAVPPEAPPPEPPASVPRETDAAALLFGERVELARRYAAHLETSGVERGLIGPREVPRLWSRHLLNCAAIAGLLPERATVADVGSGAGLPGLLLAIARPDCEVTLVEPLLRRVDWLTEVVADLALTSVRIQRCRAEELTDRFTVVTSRAVAPLRELAPMSWHLVSPGGVMLAIKGRSAADELAESEPALRRIGAASWRVERCGDGMLDEPTTVVVIERSPEEPSTRRAGRRAAGHPSVKRRTTRRRDLPEPRNH